MKLVEAEKAMSEDDGILGGFCRGLDTAWQEMRWGHTVFGADAGIIVLYRGAKV